jgi:putative oxidoreductase
LPDIVGPAVALLELVGGIMLVVGLLTRVVALLLALEMIGTTLLVKIDVGLIAPMGGGAGAEIDVALWAGMVALVILGPGILALDRLIGIERRSSA